MVGFDEVQMQNAARFDWANRPCTIFTNGEVGRILDRAERAEAEVQRLRRLNESLVSRIAAQSELLTRAAERPSAARLKSG